MPCTVEREGDDGHAGKVSSGSYSRPAPPGGSSLNASEELYKGCRRVRSRHPASYCKHMAISTAFCNAAFVLLNSSPVFSSRHVVHESDALQPLTNARFSRPRIHTKPKYG
jgi:hypothetical protein